MFQETKEKGKILDLINIVPIPLFEDNYSYLIYSNLETGVLIDPADSNVIQTFLSTNYPSMKISHIFLTHKHWDHSGGVPELIPFLLKNNKNLEIVAGEEEDLKFTTISVKGNEQIVTIFGSIDVKCIKVPCHTKGHCLYYINTNSEKANNLDDQQCFQCKNCVFTGDTLFIGGCGKFFEGNAEDMHRNLELIKKLPLDTLIFCGHEYTVSNLEWAVGIDWDNKIIQKKLVEAKEKRSKGKYTIPSNVENELDINVFLKYNSDLLKERLKLSDEIEILAKLRELKNNKISLRK